MQSSSGRMSRCDDVKSVVGAAEGRGALWKKSAALGHMGTGRKGGTERGGAGSRGLGCFDGDETGVMLGVEVVSAGISNTEVLSSSAILVAGFSFITSLPGEELGVPRRDAG